MSVKPVGHEAKAYTPSHVPYPEGKTPSHLDQGPSPSLAIVSSWNIGLSIEILTSKKPYDRETKIFAGIRLVQGIVGYVYAILLVAKIIAAIVVGGFSVAALATPLGLLIVGSVLIIVEIALYAYRLHLHRPIMKNPLFKHKDLLIKKPEDLTKKNKETLWDALKSIGVQANDIEEKTAYTISEFLKDGNLNRTFLRFALNRFLFHFKNEHLSSENDDKKKFQKEVAWQRVWSVGPAEDIQKELLSIHEDSILELEKMQEFLKVIYPLQRMAMIIKIFSMISCLLCFSNIFFNIFNEFPVACLPTICTILGMVFGYSGLGLDLYTSYKTTIPHLLH